MEHPLRGGVQESLKRCSTAAFPYLSNSAVVIHRESARSCRTRKKGGDESAPPQTGGHVALDSRAVFHASIRPHGGRSRPHLSLREGLEQPPEGALKEGTRTYEMAVAPVGKNPFPSRRTIPDRSSPSRVRFAASRPGPLRADLKGRLCLRGKGGIQISQ